MTVAEILRRLLGQPPIERHPRPLGRKPYEPQTKPHRPETKA
jgi:hypothetical protein